MLNFMLFNEMQPLPPSPKQSFIFQKELFFYIT